MDTRRIRKLIELVKETGIGELEVKSGDESVRISCHSNLTATPAAIPQAPVNTPTVTPEGTTTSSSDIDQQEGYTQKSPMVGTAYLSSTPGEAPFVKVGQHVEAGDTLCLIEAMKMFNKIEADKAGVISARLIENESPVEFDQPLFIIDTNE